MKKNILILSVLLVFLQACTGQAVKIDSKTPAEPIHTSISIDTTSGGKPISPYIYGINGSAGVPAMPDKKNVTVKAMRLGGNRMTGYNWETNMSNAGSDWHHFNDGYMIPRDRDGSIPGITVIDFVERARVFDAYPLVSLQMAGYVSNDGNRGVSEQETAPSRRFAKVEHKKNAPFTLKPDTTDGVVYSDEFVNYLVTTLGNSRSGGVRGFSLDNEPAIWPHTHPRIHPEKTTVKEILEKSVSLASAVKDIDPNVEIFGPSLYGVEAYVNFQSAPDWPEYSKNYKWFIDAYLDGMRKASEEKRRRLLDVLTIHYYTEARSPNADHRISFDNDNNEECIHTRFQSTRTLWDKTYFEWSWISQVHRRFLPIIPNIAASIEQYYPGTKLAIGEYNFGAENAISGGIAQADALGVFATHGVYFAAFWPHSEELDYVHAGLNLYTNYNYNGGKFGDTLAESSTDNIVYSSVFASTGENDNLHFILLNKSIHSVNKFSIGINSDLAYKNFSCYGFDAGSHVIKLMDSGSINLDESGKFNYDLPPLSAYHFIFTKE